MPDGFICVAWCPDEAYYARGGMFILHYIIIDIDPFVVFCLGVIWGTLEHRKRKLTL